MESPWKSVFKNDSGVVHVGMWDFSVYLALPSRCPQPSDSEFTWAELRKTVGSERSLSMQIGGHGVAPLVDGESDSHISNASCNIAVLNMMIPLKGGRGATIAIIDQ